MMITIRNRRSQVDCSRRVLDSIIEKLHFSGPRAVFRIAWKPHERFQAPPAHLFLDSGKIELGYGEDRVDWVYSLNR